MNKDIQNLKIYVPSALPFIAITLTLSAYWPGLNGIFILDDVHVLQRLNDHGGITNFNAFLHYIFDDRSGVVGRPISMLSFLVNDQFWPGDPWSYKYTNVLIHIICGLCLFLFVYKVCITIKLTTNASLAVAILTTTIWLLHPLNVSTTLYVVQRMTQLMSLFTLIGLLCYVHGRTIIDSNTPRGIFFISLCLAPFGLLAFLCKENGILILFYVLALEATIFRSFTRPKVFKWWLIAAVGIPVILLIGYFTVNWTRFTFGFQLRDFSVYERLLTESRILLMYLSHILLPRSSGTGLFHDDIAISTGVFSPISTVMSIAVILSALIIGIKVRKPHPLISFAIFWFFSGHLLESTFLNLELYFEHRNYLPMLGIIFAASYYIVQAGMKMKQTRMKNLPYFLSIGVILYLFATTLHSSTIWSNPAHMIPTWAAEHPNSFRAQTTFAQYLAINNQPDNALSVLHTTSSSFQKDISSLLNSAILECEYNIKNDETFQKLITRSKNAAYTDSLLPSSKKLIDLVLANRCINLDASQLHKILYAIENIPSISDRNTIFSKLLFNHANVYVQQGNLSGAMDLLDKARIARANVSIPLYQAMLLDSAGLYKESLEYLTLAEKIDHNRGAFTPSRVPEIATYREILKQKLNYGQ